MDKLQQLFTDTLAVRPHDLESLMALLLPCIANGNIAQAVEHIGKPKCTVKATAAPNMAQWYELDDVALPVDSIAVINLSGMLYVWETKWLMRQLEAAEFNPRICGVVIVVDGPGGMSSHVEQAAVMIENYTKPTATVVTGVMASAHFWLGTASDRTFIASPMCRVGSVGALCEHYNLNEYFRQNGIDYRVIYPDSCDLKNKEVRALDDNGDEEPMKSLLGKIHKIFADAVSRQLGVAYDPKLPLFRGEMFDGDEAVELGYIDQMGGISDAARWVLAQATIEKTKLHD